MAKSSDELFQELQARVMAQEMMLVSTTARMVQILRAIGVQHDWASERANLIAGYQAIAVPGVDPALSELLSSQFTEAMDDLMRQVEQRLAC